MYKNKIIIIIVISLIILLLLIKYIIHQFTYKIIDSKPDKDIFKNNKPIIWFYWENINGKKRPGYIDLCIESIYKNCNESFNVVELNETNINEYLPEIKLNKMNFSKLKIAQKVDFYRILLMYKYGGIYIDVDILVLKNLDSIIDKLKIYDYVGFGCTGNVCKIGTSKPSNWLLCSRPKTKLMKNILYKYIEKLKLINKENSENIGYHDFGKMIIWEELDKLINQENYKYYHYPNLYDGTRDINGTWVSMDRLFSKENIIYDNPNELMFIVLYNSDANEHIKSITKEDILKSDYFISKYFKI